MYSMEIGGRINFQKLHFPRLESSIYLSVWIEKASLESTRQNANGF